MEQDSAAPTGPSGETGTAGTTATTPATTLTLSPDESVGAAEHARMAEIPAVGAGVFVSAELRSPLPGAHVELEGNRHHGLQIVTEQSARVPLQGSTPRLILAADVPPRTEVQGSLKRARIVAEEGSRDDGEYRRPRKRTVEGSLEREAASEDVGFAVLAAEVSAGDRDIDGTAADDPTATAEAHGAEEATMVTKPGVADDDHSSVSAPAPDTVDKITGDIGPVEVASTLRQEAYHQDGPSPFQAVLGEFDATSASGVGAPTLGGRVSIYAADSVAPANGDGVHPHATVRVTASLGEGAPTSPLTSVPIMSAETRTLAPNVELTVQSPFEAGSNAGVAHSAHPQGVPAVNATIAHQPPISGTLADGPRPQLSLSGVGGSVHLPPFSPSATGALRPEQLRAPQALPPSPPPQASSPSELSRSLSAPMNEPLSARMSGPMLEPIPGPISAKFSVPVSGSMAEPMPELSSEPLSEPIGVHMPDQMPELMHGPSPGMMEGGAASGPRGGAAPGAPPMLSYQQTQAVPHPLLHVGAATTVGAAFGSAAATPLARVVEVGEVSACSYEEHQATTESLNPYSTVAQMQPTPDSTTGAIGNVSVTDNATLTPPSLLTAFFLGNETATAPGNPVYHSCGASKAKSRTRKRKNVAASGGEKPRRNRKRPACATEGCVRRPLFGWQGTRQAQFCSSHREPGMINVLCRRCEVDGCRHQPSFGLPGGRPQRCSLHKEAGMVNVSAPRCQSPGCDVVPSFGKRGGKKGILCGAHRREGDIDLVTCRCHHEGCVHRPVFGHPNEKKAYYCAAHKLEGMVNVFAPQCVFPGCLHQPSWGVLGEKRPTHCAKHRTQQHESKR